MLTRLAPTLRQLTAKRGEIGQLTDRIAGIDQELEESAKARGEALAVVSCELRRVSGYSSVRQSIQRLDSPQFHKLSPKELHARLRESVAEGMRLFAGGKGTFTWRPEGTAPPAESGQDQK